MKCGRPWCCPGKEHVVSRPNIRIVSYVNCGLARLGQPSLRPPRLHRRRRRRPREESMSRHNARPHAPPFARMLGSVVDLALAFRLGGIDRRVCVALNSTKKIAHYVVGIIRMLCNCYYSVNRVKSVLCRI